MVKANNDKTHYLALSAILIGIVLNTSIIVNLDYDNFESHAPITLILLITLGFIFFVLPLKALKHKKAVIITKKHIIIKKSARETQTLLLKDLISWQFSSLRYSTGVHLNFKDGTNIFLSAEELSNFYTLENILNKNYKSKLVQ